MKRFVLLLMVSLFGGILMGCGNGVKTTPAKVGDTVFVQYTAVFDAHPKLLFDTTDKAVVKHMKSSLSKQSYGPEKIILGESGTLCSYIQDQLIGMKAGEKKTIIVKPQDCRGNDYNKSNVKVEPLLIYTKANISIKKGDIRYKNNTYVKVKKITGKGNTATVTFDMNPLQTYEPVRYDVVVKQVGGDALADNK